HTLPMYALLLSQTCEGSQWGRPCASTWLTESSAFYKCFLSRKHYIRHNLFSHCFY
uniref:Uncharacterized protein n=1 Tax=Anser brachyrhynchus TaxID=132585 RepID=A0A8B9BXX2_9AVES